MTKIISMQDIRLSLASIADEAERGEQFVVVRNSKPAFRIMPVEASGSLGAGSMTLKELRARFDAVPPAQSGLKPSDVDDVIHRIHEQR